MAARPAAAATAAAVAAATAGAAARRAAAVALRPASGASAASAAAAAAAASSAPAAAAAAAAASQRAAAVSAAAVSAAPQQQQRRWLGAEAHRIEAQHEEVPQVNSASTPFEFTEENLALVRDTIAKYPPQYKKAALIPILDIAQRQHGGWLPLAAMNKTAKILEIPPMAVYETASFYTMFNRKPIGKVFFNVCTTTPCMLRGAYDVLEAAKERLGVDVGGTTPDGMFTLGEVECAGACVNAPVIAIGDDYYEDCTPEDAVKLIDAVAAGKVPERGPMNGRTNCEPKGGLTSLTEEPYGPMWRDELDEVPAAFPK